MKRKRVDDHGELNWGRNEEMWAKKNGRKTHAFPVRVQRKMKNMKLPFRQKLFLPSNGSGSDGKRQFYCCSNSFRSPNVHCACHTQESGLAFCFSFNRPLQKRNCAIISLLNGNLLTVFPSIRLEGCAIVLFRLENGQQECSFVRVYATQREERVGVGEETGQLYGASDNIY